MSCLVKYVLPVLALAACSSKNGVHDADADALVDGHADVLDGAEVDVPGDGTDTPVDSVDGLDPCDVSIDGPEYDVSYLDLVDVSTIPATDCGECCRQVSFAEHPIERCYYDVSGRYLVFTTANSGSSPLISRTYLVDLLTLEHFLISETSSADLQWLQSVHIEGTSVLYHELLFTSIEAPGTSRFTLLDLSAGTRNTIHEIEHPLGGHPFDLAFSGEWLAWLYNDEAVPTETSQLYVMNVEWTDARKVDTGTDSTPMGIDLFDDQVVYSELSHWVRIYDITGDSISDVAGDSTFDWHRYNPAIWESIVVWHDVRNGGTYASQTHADIYMMDLTAGTETVVCDDPASQPRQVDVGYGYIVWPDARADPEPNVVDGSTNLDIYAREVGSGTEFVVSSMPGGEYCPTIVSDRIYFVMESNAGVLSVFEKGIH